MRTIQGQACIPKKNVFPTSNEGLKGNNINKLKIPHNQITKLKGKSCLIKKFHMVLENLDESNNKIVLHRSMNYVSQKL